MARVFTARGTVAWVAATGRKRASWSVRDPGRTSDRMIPHIHFLNDVVGHVLSRRASG
jgi:hypothetical protein